MDKFLKRKSTSMQMLLAQETIVAITEQNSSMQNHLQVDLENLLIYLGLWSKILDYHPNYQDKVKRAYLQKGPYLPHNHNFPRRKIGKFSSKFNSAWFDKYGNWL